MQNPRWRLLWRGFPCFTPPPPAIGAPIPTVCLQKETTLSLDGFHGRGTFFIVVSHVIDPSAYGIASH